MVGTLVSREIRVLEKAGFITRATDGSDGRAVILSLTASGRDAYGRLRQASVEATGKALATWRADELADLAHLLIRVADDFTSAAKTPNEHTARPRSVRS